MQNQLLNEIISHRHKHVASLRAQEESLNLIRRNLKKLNTMGLPDSPTPLPIDADWYKKSLRKIDQGLDLCDRLIARFSKKTINIGVAGRARQGKSTLLQTLTGLEDDMIPTSSGTQNTGTRSTFYFTDDVPGVEVEYYTESEFLDQILKEYYIVLDAEDQLPESLRDFEDIVEFPSINTMNPKHETTLNALKKLQSQIGDVRSFFNKPSQRIREEDIKNFVSQVEGRTRYLAVKNVKVFIQANQNNCNDLVGLGVIDLPGLGEIALGHERKLVESLRHEVDVVLIVRKPDQDGDYWNQNDIGLLQLLQETIPEVAFRHWLYILLNRRDDDSNLDIIRQLQSEREKLPPDLKMLVCNCIDKDEVRTTVFEQILGQMRAELETIDQSFLKRQEEFWGELFNILKPFNQLSPVNMSTQARVEGDHQCAKHFEQSWDLLTKKFRELYSKLNQASQGIGISFDFKTKDNEIIQQDFKGYIHQIELELSDSHCVPEVEELQDHKKKGSGIRKVIDYELTRLRTQLSSMFTKRIDGYLDGFFTHEFEHIFRKHLPTPFLNIIWKIAGSEYQASSSNDETVREIFDKFLDAIGSYGEQTKFLQEGFEFLLKSQFDYFTLFHHYVRKEMTNLDPINHKTTAQSLESLFPDGILYTPEMHEDLRRGLVDNYQLALSAVCATLIQLHFNPYQALFALLEEFSDRVIWMENEDMHDQSRDQWRRLFLEHREVAWPDEFGVLQQSNEEQNRRFTLAHEVMSLITQYQH